MATVTNYYTATFSASVDGYPYRGGVNQTFTNIRSGAGTGVSNSIASTSNSALLVASATTNQYAELDRDIMLFNTSSIPSNAVITSVDMYLYGSQKSNLLGTTTLEIVSSNPASTSSLASSDYSTLGSTSFGSISYASFNLAAYTKVSLNASGLANITKAGTSKFGAVLGWDLNNSFTGSWSTNVATGFIWNSVATGSNLPYIVVSYSVDFPTLSINNISSLSNVTTITTS